MIKSYTSENGYGAAMKIRGTNMTYEEFFDEVVESLSRDLVGEFDIKNKDDVRKYIKLQEDVVKERYQLNYKKYKQGEFSYAVWADCANSVAYCLYMMY
jgi:hypothetical protein